MPPIIPQQISAYMVGDFYAPATPKPALQQYDNYQIYSLYGYTKSTVVTYTDSDAPPGTSTITTETKAGILLAVQQYSPYRKIPCDFRAIALQYPGT